MQISYKRKLFMSYDKDNDDKLYYNELILYFDSINYPITIATHMDLTRFGSDTECQISWQNLINFWTYSKNYSLKFFYT